MIHEGEPGDDLTVSLTELTRHTLIVGAPGSGKTTTVLSTLARLWREHQVPFLAVEPIKKEYRSLLDAPGMEALHVISLGREDLSPLRINPLLPPPGVRCETQLSAVITALKAALPLPVPLPQLLEEALERAYTLAGWEYETTAEDGLTPPTLRDLLRSFEDVFDDAHYSGDALNLKSAVQVRLGSLLRGSRGRVLDTVESTDFDQLMNRPVIIELNDVPDPTDKAVLLSLLLDRVRASASARGSTGGHLRHVTVIEEAHRLLARTNTGASAPAAEGLDPRAEGVRALCEAIAELRSVGEGFILSSQSPSELAPAAVANTGIRIAHRMESALDRNLMLDDFDAGPREREAAARLRRGEAIMRSPDRDETEFMTVVPAEGVDSSAVVADSEVARRTQDAAQATRALLPYALCTRAVCARGCEPAVRNSGMRSAMTISKPAQNIWIETRGQRAALEPLARLMTTATTAVSTQQCYCIAVHLAVSRDALHGGQVDIRPALAAAVTEAVDTYNGVTGEK